MIEHLANPLFRVVTRYATIWPSTHAQHGALLEEMGDMQAEIERLLRELEDMAVDRDDWKDRWAILGRVSKHMIDRLERELALYREHGSPDLTRMVEYEAKLAARHD